MCGHDNWRTSKTSIYSTAVHNYLTWSIHIWAFLISNKLFLAVYFCLQDHMGHQKWWEKLFSSAGYLPETSFEKVQVIMK